MPVPHANTHVSQVLDDTQKTSRRASLRCLLWPRWERRAPWRVLYVVGNAGWCLCPERGSCAEPWEGRFRLRGGSQSRSDLCPRPLLTFRNASSARSTGVTGTCFGKNTTTQYSGSFSLCFTEMSICHMSSVPGLHKHLTYRPLAVTGLEMTTRHRKCE